MVSSGEQYELNRYMETQTRKTRVYGKKFELCELRDLPGRKCSTLFSEGHNFFGNPYNFRSDQPQGSASPHRSKKFNGTDLQKESI